MTDIYIGFMDEEVRPILTQLQKEGWNVLVIERGNIDPQGVLFERPISAYDYGVMWKGWCGLSDTDDGPAKLISVPNILSSEKLGDSRRTWLNAFQQCMYINLLETYRKLPDGILETENGKAIKRKLGLIPSVSMLYMGDAEGRAGGLPTKILIRSPEMGQQPGLIRTQLRGILKALKSASNATPDNDGCSDQNKINIWCYGAGGAYCERPIGGPGTLWEVKGSLYMGVERDKSAELRRSNKDVPLYAGEIAYCSEQDNVSLFTTPSFYTVAEAREHVETTFIKKSTDSGSLLFKQTNAISSILEITKPQSGITISSNSFMGEEVKRAAANYSLEGGTNMEDYHLYKLIQSLLASQKNFTSVKRIEAKYPLINKTKFIRIDADPASVPSTESFATDFKDANPKKISVSDYADVLKWGLEGMDLKKVPDSLSWGIVLENVTKDLIPYKGEQKTAKYINPFLLEAAQDLFREVREWLDKVSKSKKDKGRQQALNENPFNAKELTLEKIREVQEHFAILENNLTNFCKKKVGDINHDYCIDFIAALYKMMGCNITEVVPIWARSGWGAEHNEIYITANAKFFGKRNTNIDRALYKSNNTVVLDINANIAVTKLFQ